MFLLYVRIIMCKQVTRKGGGLFICRPVLFY